MANYSLFALRAYSVLYAVLMILFLVGFFQTTPPFFNTLTFWLKIFTALFLIYRFNPYFNVKNSITPLDREFVMFAAFFILLASFTDYVNDFLQNAKRWVGSVLPIPG